jgi:hypothetical protein
MEVLMSTGPQKYPSASTAHWYQDKYSSDAMEVNVLVLHTTEGTSLPDYSGGSEAPNLTAVPDFTHKKLVWYQHFDIDRSARALVNLTGGVETNTLNVVQVEMVGTCDPATHKKWGSAPHIYWPQAPDWAPQGVADFMAWLHTNHGVPLSGVSNWKAYPASYGASNGSRMSASAWESFNGVCGHQHVPENLHGDPGALDFAKLLTFAKGTSPTPPTTTSGTGAAKPKVSLAHVIAAAKADPKATQGHTTHAADVKPVEAALLKLGYLAKTYASDGSFGSTTVSAYGAYQRHLGYTGADADGIPGETSLKKLASTTGLFTVMA